jgi:hypothetical protein
MLHAHLLPKLFISVMNLKYDLNEIKDGGDRHLVSRQSAITFEPFITIFDDNEASVTYYSTKCVHEILTKSNTSISEID